MIRLLSIALAVVSAAPACVANQESFELQSNDWQEQISHRNPHIRRRAAEKAERLPLNTVRDLLWNVLKYDNDDETVGRTATTLGKMVGEPNESDVDALLIAFDRVSEFYARGRAALALGKFAPRLSAAMTDRVIKTFIAWLDSRDENAERYVAEALGMFGGKARAAIPALEALRKRHKWQQTRKAATAALKLIQGAQR